MKEQKENLNNSQVKAADIESSYDDLFELIGINIPEVLFEVFDLEHVQELIENDSQRDRNGKLVYLISGGLAVEAITGFKRPHYDIDVVVLDDDAPFKNKRFTENLTPDCYWAGMTFSPAYLEQTAWEARIESEGDEKIVYTVHPGILLVQKLSNHLTLPLRQKDIADVEQLFNFWRDQKNSDPSWIQVMEVAIDALPENEKQNTRDRLRHYLD